LTASGDDNLGFMYTTASAAKNLTKFLACTDTGKVNNLRKDGIFSMSQAWGFL